MASVNGIESNETAVNDAKFNAKNNKIGNVSFICGDVSLEVEKIFNMETSNITSVLINPPRTGCSVELKRALVKSNVDKIVYISCDPSTLARDVSYFTSKGFLLQKVQPIDMFPQTIHIETVVSMTRDN